MVAKEGTSRFLDRCKHKAGERALSQALTMSVLLHRGASQMSAMSQKINDEERENKPKCKQGSTSPASALGLLSLKA